MNAKSINQLAAEISAANIEKGFQTPSLGTCLMLIVTELSEAIEAHRKNKHADLPGLLEYESAIGFSPGLFESKAKDSFEDEIADAYIRVLDTFGRFKMDFRNCDPGDVTWYVEDADNIPERTLYLVKLTADTLGTADVQFMLSSLLVEIRDFCAYFKVRLDDHVRLKLMYNKTRPHKHGKAY